MKKGVCSYCQRSGLSVYMAPPSGNSQVDFDLEDIEANPSRWILDSHRVGFGDDGDTGNICVGTGSSPESVYDVKVSDGLGGQSLSIMFGGDHVGSDPEGNELRIARMPKGWEAVLSKPNGGWPIVVIVDEKQETIYYSTWQEAVDAGLQLWTNVVLKGE